jgi:hypothetical protein
MAVFYGAGHQRERFMSIPLPKGAHPVRIAITTAFLSIGLAACGVVNTLVDGYKHARAVEEDLEQATGLKPNIGFNFNNGRLLLVSVTYPRLYDAKSMHELAEAARAAIQKEFQQTPENIVLAFSVGPGDTAK